MVDITDVTDGVLSGDGYFDKFMDTINVHLDNQFKQGRIQGKDYASVYLGSVQAALAQAISYVNVVEQVRASGIQTSIASTQSAKDIEVKDQQIAVQAEQVIASTANTEIAEKQSTKDLLVKQEQIDASEAKRTAEVALLNQKKESEIAQTADLVTAGTVRGAIGKQKDLHQAQIDGFARDAEQKATKIVMDAWAVSKSVSGDIIDAPDGARNDDIEDMLIKLRTGIGVTESIYKFQADAGSDQVVEAGSFVQLFGDASTAPVSAPISTYQWQVIANDTTSPNPTLSGSGATANITFDATPLPGTLVLKLTTTDSLAATSIATVSVVVEEVV